MAEAYRVVVVEDDCIAALLARGYRNYWGYNPLAYFAPAPEYVTEGAGVVVANASGIDGAAGFDSGAAVLVSVLGIVVNGLYYGLLEGGAGGASLGKKACGLKVVDQDTFEAGIGIPRSLARFGVGLAFELPGQFIAFLGLLGLVDILAMLGSERKQTLHDRATRTCVVKVR